MVVRAKGDDPKTTSETASLMSRCTELITLRNAVICLVGILISTAIGYQIAHNITMRGIVNSERRQIVALEEMIYLAQQRSLLKEETLSDLRQKYWGLEAKLQHQSGVLAFSQQNLDKKIQENKKLYDIIGKTILKGDDCDFVQMLKRTWKNTFHSDQNKFNIEELCSIHQNYKAQV